MLTSEFVVGQRVRLAKQLESFAMGDVPKVGDTGTVVDVHGQWGSVAVSAEVWFDTYYADLSEWDNQIQVGTRDDSYARPDDFVIDNVS